MTDEQMKLILRAISLSHKIGQRDRYWSNIEVTTEGERTAVKCIVTIDDRQLLIHNETAAPHHLVKLVDMLEYTKNETTEDALNVLATGKGGY